MIHADPTQPEMISFSPEFSGRVQIRTPAALFLERFKERVEAGLLAGRSHWRWRYVVTKYTDDELSFSAAGLMTAINVGLNRVTLRKVGADQIEYQVTYRTWAAYCVGLGATLAMIGFILYFFLNIGEVMAQQRMLPDPGLNQTIGLTIYWGSVIGWGFLWPWFLIGLHKSPVKTLLLRIVREVDNSST